MTGAWQRSAQVGKSKESPEMDSNVHVQRDFVCQILSLNHSKTNSAISTPLHWIASRLSRIPVPGPR